MKTSPSDFLQFCQTMGLPAPVAEHPFAKSIGRRWRFDYAWPDAKLALEVEGGGWIGGRHTSGAGFEKDCAKYNRAACMGWRVLRVTPSDLLKLSTVELVKEARCA